MLNNTIQYYNNTEYSGKPIKLNDFLTDKYNEIHSQLYNYAISNYIDSTDYKDNKSQFFEDHKLIEIKGKNYYDPSNVIIINLSNNTQQKIDLTTYWNTYQKDIVNNDISYIYIDDDTRKDAEIIYIDYIKGKTKLRSRFTNTEFWVDNNYINSGTRKSSGFSLNNTFTQLYNNR